MSERDSDLATARAERNKPGRATPGAADFLREVHLEASEQQRVVLRELAQRLGVSAPAVSRMAQRLVRKGYIKREGACGLALTESGQRVAMKSLRKMRIFECFLVRELGYGWDEVYTQAAASAHHLEDDLIERMWAKLGKPHKCPHGDAIPSRDGRIDHVSTTALTEVEAGSKGTLDHVSTHNGEMLRYLATLGLVPGVPLTLVNRAPFGGPIRVRVRRPGPKPGFEDEHVIGPELAGVIHLAAA
jgi:DtxR family transcriptional regulator, Mn-dependent transcriptional regulator